jgi:hypothetical protein
MATKSIPDGYHSVTPYLIVKGAAAQRDSCRKQSRKHCTDRFEDPNFPGEIQVTISLKRVSCGTAFSSQRTAMATACAVS